MTSMQKASCECGSYVKHIKPHYRTKKHKKLITAKDSLSWCSCCKALGHTNNSCISDYIQNILFFLPKDVVNIIYHFKCDLEYAMNRHNFLIKYTHPQCRVFKTKSTIWLFLKNNIKCLLDKVRILPTRNERIQVIAEIYNILIDRFLFIPHTHETVRFIHIVQRKLRTFYIENNWVNASYYHRKLFGTFL